MGKEYEDVSMEMLEDKPKSVSAEAQKIVEHFSKAIKQGESLIVDEAMALQYADVCADIKALEETKGNLSKLLFTQRAGSEKAAMVGRAMIEYTDVKDQTDVDWKAMYLAQNGEP